MTKVEMIKKIADKSGYTQTAIREVFDTFDEVVLGALAEGQDVKEGIITFVVKDTPARKGRNPKTGATVDVPAGKKVAVKMSKMLKESVK